MYGLVARSSCQTGKDCFLTWLDGVKVAERPQLFAPSTCTTCKEAQGSIAAQALELPNENQTRIRTPCTKARFPGMAFFFKFKFIFIYLFICSTPPSSQQKAIIKGGKKIGNEWERIEELNETFLQYYIYVQV